MKTFVAVSLFCAGVLPVLACSDGASPDAVAGGAGQLAAAGAVNAAGSSGAPASAGSAAQVGGAGSTSAGAPASSGNAGSAEQGGAAGSSGGTTGLGGGAGSSAAGSSAAGSGGNSEVKKSAGCGKTTSQALNQFVDGMVMSNGSNRPYAVRLPTGYDAARAYPVVVLLHGCGSGTNNVTMEKSTGADAILIRGTGSGSGTCWDTKANGPDIAFFDAMVADVKARFCTDERRFFAVGYSSGSWFANQLTCIRSEVIRGAGTVTGGESSNGQCGSPVARIFIHDKDDTTNVISGSERARDRQLTQNKCDKNAAPTAVDPSPCKAYQGCAKGYPVEWCQTSGQQHSRQDNLAAPAFWNFFKSL